MNSNSIPATFWLTWHIFEDPDLLTRVLHEAEICKLNNSPGLTGFDTTKLCRQPLLQSCYTETLRKYVAVYIIRQPQHQDAKILEYQIPKGKMIVVSSAMAHMDKRNWNTGTGDEHPVESFWGGRFLTNQPKSSRKDLNSINPKINNDSTTLAGLTISTNTYESTSQEARFSLNGYSGAWVPFGGGIHQCPGRHWVKLQMLVSFAMISAAFEIELRGNGDGLRVDMRKYGLGALQPAEKAGFRIRRKSQIGKP